MRNVKSGMFIFSIAAASSSLANVCRFPYIVAQNGGGVFVLLYLIDILFFGIALIIAEMVIGRIGQHNPVISFKRIAQNTQHAATWKWVGVLILLTGFTVAIYYLMMTCFFLDYLGRALLGELRHITAMSSGRLFHALRQNFMETLITLLWVIILAMGVTHLHLKKSLERFIPFLLFIGFLLLLFVVIYNVLTKNISFPAFFFINWHVINIKILWLALGQAFLSLNLGVGVIIMQSAYADRVPIPSSAFFIVLLNIVFALLAALIVFSAINTFHLNPDAGVALIFQAFPLEFSIMPMRSLLASSFFFVFGFAAVMGWIILLEPVINGLISTWRLRRTLAMSLVYGLCGLCGFLISMNADFFIWLDHYVIVFLLLLTGMLTALFSSWVLRK